MVRAGDEAGMKQCYVPRLLDDWPAAKSLTDVAKHAGKVLQLLQQMQAGQYDIITVYYGDSVSAQDAQAVAEHILEAFPGPEVEVVNGQQPHYQYIISAE